MHVLLGGRANIEPPAVGDTGLPADMVFDVRDLCQDSQHVFSRHAADPLLSGDEEETADREEESIDLLEDDEVDNQTAPVADGDDFFQTAMHDVTGVDKLYQTARADEDGGPEMENQTARSAVDVEANAAQTSQQNRRPQQSRGDVSVQSVDDVMSSGKTIRSRDRPSPPERKTSLITAYEEQVKEKLVLKKEAQDQKASFRDAILEDRRHAREQREREPEFKKESRLCAGLERTAILLYTRRVEDRAVEVSSVVERSSDMAHERTLIDEENATLIQAVSGVYSSQIASPNTLRIWDLIVVNLQNSGVQCMACGG
ncbi:hypothetical protein R1sor_007532 [Riccia sorocarpa]|uniref:Uncharacterized protein n=1 Tax=Riccia sorocarpa TaxID=122646 RepID=A0ABD3HUW5_9MARC